MVVMMMRIRTLDQAVEKLKWVCVGRRRGAAPLVHCQHPLLQIMENKSTKVQKYKLNENEKQYNEQSVNTHASYFLHLPNTSWPWLFHILLMTHCQMFQKVESDLPAKI